MTRRPQTSHARSEQPEFLASLVRLVADRAGHPSTHKVKICLLLGAGADISSGGLSFAELKRQAVEEFTTRAVFDITLSENVEERFERLFRTLNPDERALLVESLFRRMRDLAPSDAYKLLVLLVEAGGVDVVLTTNFDVMLETAQKQLGRDLFQIFAPGIARPYLVTTDRYELPRKPYLKLHGDIASRSVVLLTREELSASTYDSSMLSLLESVLRTHDLVLAGYSGFDTALAQIISDAVRSTNNRIYWCNPRLPATDSPLYSRIADRVRCIEIDFNQLMIALARPVLERPSLASTEPTYLRCLFDWRVDYCNREYLRVYGERSGRSYVDVFARRRVIEDRLTSFLLPNPPLAVITGPSGFGKSTIGVRLLKVWGDEGGKRLLLIRARALPDSADVEQFVCEQLGGLGAHAPFSLFKLERWLQENGLRLVLFVDGINEFSTNLDRCVQLFRNILRVCYFLPEADSALRVVATVRQETWNAMLPHLDVAQLRKALWTPGSEHAINTLACAAFTNEELNDALDRLRSHGFASIDSARLSVSATNQLRDPYLLGMVAEAAEGGFPPIPSARVFSRAFEAKLRQCGSSIDIATLSDILASVALKCLTAQQDRFREVDITPAQLRGEVVRVMKDLHVFIDAGTGFLQFDHDRTFEYFLALGLNSGAGPGLETLEDLLRFLRAFKAQSKPIAAARLHIQLQPAERFRLVTASLRLLDEPEVSFPRQDADLLFGFAREALVEMAEQGETLIQDYLEDAIEAARMGKIGGHQLRVVVQAAASLPLERGIQLLTRVAHPTSFLANTEAKIYATDKLVSHYLLSGCPSIGLLAEKPYALFFADPSIASWQRMGRLLGFAAQLGPDNTHPDEYEKILDVLNAAFGVLLSETPWGFETAREMSAFFLSNCDRLMFNASPRGIDRFFGNPRRSEFDRIIDGLAAGRVLQPQDLLVFEPYTQSLTADIEYHLSHCLFILSSLNDLDGTIRFTEERFNTFSNSTPPEEIDFFNAVLVYLHVLNGLQYNQARFARWEETILQSWPDVLLYRPGLERGERRGYQDPFDRIFEDGFGVIFPYGVLLPSICRRRFRYPEFRRHIESATATQLPLYTKYLEQFLRDDEIEKALQILHALAAVIVVWPSEGLLTLQGVIGHADPRIRRATIRILAEAFNRHPEETMQFLKTSGAAVTDADLVEIKLRQDARIGRRQINEEEWARIGHFLLHRPGARDKFIACLRALLRAGSVEEAFTKILHELVLIRSAER